MRARKVSAKTSCSPIAACPVPRSCRSRPIGGQGGDIALDLLPEHDAEALLKERKRARPKAEPKTILAELFPARLAQALAGALPQETMANIPDRTLSAFAARLKRFEVTPTGSEGYAKAEVTVGGIDTRDLSSKTMEARAGARPLRHRRGRRRHRLARRLQFPMGLGERLVCRTGHRQP